MLPQLIETLRVDHAGGIALLPRHLQRLTASSAVLGYPCDAAQVREAIAAACAPLARGTEHRLRLLLDRRGQLQLTSAPLPVWPATPPRVALAPQRLHSDTTWLRHKTTHRPWFDAATAWLANHPDHFDLLYANERDHLCEGSRSNLYLQLDGQWFTPPIACGLLPGVARAQILEAGLATERVLTLADLRQTQAVRLSNALRGWVGVCYLE